MYHKHTRTHSHTATLVHIAIGTLATPHITTTLYTRPTISLAKRAQNQDELLGNAKHPRLGLRVRFGTIHRLPRHSIYEPHTHTHKCDMWTRVPESWPFHIYRLPCECVFPLYINPKLCGHTRPSLKIHAVRDSHTRDCGANAKWILVKGRAHCCGTAMMTIRLQYCHRMLACSK